MTTKTYAVDGMTCGGCVSSLTRALESALPGLEVTVSLAPGEVRVAGDHDAALVEQTVLDAGFELADVGRAALSS